MSEVTRRLLLQIAIVIGMTIVLCFWVRGCTSGEGAERELRKRDLTIQEKTLELKTRQWRQQCMEKRQYGVDVDEYCSPDVPDSWRKEKKRR